VVLLRNAPFIDGLKHETGEEARTSRRPFVPLVATRGLRGSTCRSSRQATKRRWRWGAVWTTNGAKSHESHERWSLPERSFAPSP